MREVVAEIGRQRDPEENDRLGRFFPARLGCAVARYFSAKLHRLRGVFLAALGDKGAKIEASFCEAINTAKEQKSVSLEKRAEATYAEYRRQKASASG